MARSAPSRSPLRRTLGFTLTEMLVVIGIIILVVAMAIPAIRSLTGTRSVDAGYNTLNALITRAREEAVGLQTVHGVLFYLDTRSDLVEAAIVQETPPPNYTGAPPANTPVYFLDVVPSHDYLPLPRGIGVQTINNCSYSGTAPNIIRSTDGYLGLNPTSLIGPTSTENVLYGGVILFDGNGRLISKSYGFKLFDNTTNAATGIAQLLKVDTPAPTVDMIPLYNGTNLSSQFGLVLFDREAFKAQGFTDGDTGMDPVVTSYTGGSPSELTEETWLDTNSTPILINRYNGTLIRAE
jgi:type II secretory pathway pseudopilin PulG